MLWSQAFSDTRSDIDVVAERQRVCRVRQQPAVACRHVSGREVQAGQLHPGVFDSTDERVDLAIRRHRFGEGPPEFDSVEPGVRAACGRCSSGRSVNRIEQFTV